MVNFQIPWVRRLFRQGSAIASAKVGVRAELRWYWKVLFWSASLSVVLFLVLWGYDAGRRFAGYDSREMEHELASARAQLSDVSEKLASAEASLRAQDGRLQVELAALEQLQGQLKGLYRENASLKEDLALFEGLVAEPLLGAEAIKVARVRIEPSAVDGRYRFSVLLVRKVDAKSVRDYSGELQFALKVKSGGAERMIIVPGDGNPPASYYRFSVKHFSRIDGEFSLPAGAELAGGEVRLLQEAVVKLRHPIVLDSGKS